MQQNSVDKKLNCNQCGCNVDGIFHTCPFKTEILVGEESENELCNCCEDCKTLCVDEC